MTTPTTLEILKTARETLSDPKRWTTGWLALSRDNTPTTPELPSAQCFCAVGAILNARAKLCGDTQGKEAASTATDLLADQLPDGFPVIPSFNDHPNTTHADILALFDRAIAAQEKAQ